MFLSFEAEPPLSSEGSRTAAPRTEGNKFTSKSDGRHSSSGELRLIFRMTKCGAGRRAIAQKCAACVKDRRKCEYSSPDVNACKRCQDMGKVCHPRAKPTLTRPISSFSQIRCQRTLQSPLAQRNPAQLVPSSPLPRRTPFRNELIVSELMTQLPSLPSSEALDLARELDRLLKDWLDGYMISQLRFRRIHVQDTLTCAWLTCLDCICEGSYDATTFQGRDSADLRKICKATVIISQLEGISRQYTTTLHTSIFDLVTGCSGVQEWDDLSHRMRAFSEISLISLKDSQNFIEDVHAENSYDIHLVEMGMFFWPDPFSILARIKRACAWGAVAAWEQRFDYRFFSSCLLGVFGQSSPCSSGHDLSLKLVPLLRVNDFDYGHRSFFRPPSPSSAGWNELHTWNQVFRAISKTESVKFPEDIAGQGDWLLSNCFEKIYLGPELLETLYRAGWRAECRVQFEPVALPDLAPR